jgi:hypothetical protein
MILAKLSNEICALLYQIHVSVTEIRTTDPGSAGRLQISVSMDSKHMERWDSMYYWQCSMCFCDRRLCREWISWSAKGYKKEWCDLNELWICCSTHQKLLNPRLMYRSGQVFIEERAGGRLGRWERLRRFLCIWRCQNNLDGPKDWGNTVERLVNRFQTLGTLRFQGLLRFQLDFQFISLLPALDG